MRVIWSGVWWWCLNFFSRRLAEESNRIEFFNTSFNPYVRHTFINVLFGTFILWGGPYTTSQYLIHRALCLPTIFQGKVAWSKTVKYCETPYNDFFSFQRPHVLIPQFCRTIHHGHIGGDCWPYFVCILQGLRPRFGRSCCQKRCRGTLICPSAIYGKGSWSLRNFHFLSIFRSTQHLGLCFACLGISDLGRNQGIWPISR